MVLNSRTKYSQKKSLVSQLSDSYYYYVKIRARLLAPLVAIHRCCHEVQTMQQWGGLKITKEVTARGTFELSSTKHQKHHAKRPSLSQPSCKMSL